MQFFLICKTLIRERNWPLSTRYNTFVPLWLHATVVFYNWFFHYECSFLLLRSRPFVFSGSLVPFHTFSLCFLRERESSHQGLFYRRIFPSSVRENFPIENLRAASAIRFLSSCCSDGGDDSIPKHSGWEKERKKRERECNLPKSPSSAILARSFAIPRANPTGIPSYSRCPIVPVCESPFLRCVSYSATNCRRDGRR